ncbi:Serine hydrolase-like protein [Seminavis robusta]|uniref:Serine hydrolase-like protein n=1 Tax=Seminavis robusta TaxID=568900 RepID=A0A9N8D8P5_9STRA|nr:Serine hydrolase-like protein [Seminavis robusta]|eukprot:Sro17_g012160.1 Serine hydrolase-like protein (374) ;mRNA; f:43381-44502
MLCCGGDTVILPKATEMKLDCSDGIQLAAQSWKVSTTSSEIMTEGVKPEELRVLCLHGWMDNANSFHILAPALIEYLDANMAATTEQQVESKKAACFRSVHVVCLDLPGHGLSSHRSQDAPPMIRAEYLFYVAEALRQLQWVDKPKRGNNRQPNDNKQKFVIVGHSMGSGIALLYAAAFPEQVRQLVFLDALAPLVGRSDTSTAQNLRQYVQTRQLDGQMLADPANRFYYPSKEAATKARINSAKSFPGNQYISQMAAEQLVERGVVEDEPINSNNGALKRRFRFRHDPRLAWKSLLNLTQDQLDELYREVQCPTCILLGQDGWPFEEAQKQRVQQVLQPTVFKTMPGSHSLHADPDVAEAVVQEIVEFLLQQ